MTNLTRNNVTPKLTECMREVDYGQVDSNSGRAKYIPVLGIDNSNLVRSLILFDKPRDPVPRGEKVYVLGGGSPKCECTPGIGA